MRHRLEFSPEALAHLGKLSARDQVTILDKVEAQLSMEPLKATRQRKQLRSNSIAVWELRVGDFRVFYDVQIDPEPAVLVRAVGVKRHNRLFLGEEEVSL